MRRRLIAMLALVVGLEVTTGTRAIAQTATPPTQPQAEPPMSVIDRLKEPDQAGGLHFTEHFAVVFGGIKQGSGIALGPAWSTEFPDESFVQLKGVYSIRKFKLLQLRYDSRPFWAGRGIVISRVRWQDAPELKLYQLGQQSPDRRVDYAERKTEASSQVILKPRPHVRVAGGFSIERFRTSADRLTDLYDPTLILSSAPLGLTVAPLPGLGTRPWFAHTFGTVGYDTREYPEYSRSGHFAELELHDYHDVKGGQDGFQRVEMIAQQMVPMFHRRGVIDIEGRTWLSVSDDPRSVPFYLMPTLGGGELLRAFPSYRFRDRHALLLKGEYRWAVHKMVDLVGIYEVGKVAPKLGDLTLGSAANSVAFGVRGHTEKTTLFRADIAHGREGWGFRIGFSAGS